MIQLSHDTTVHIKLHLKS